MSNLQSKMMDRMFKKVEGVVVDMTTNSIGLVRDGSVFSVSKDEDGDYGLSENLFAEMSMSIPAFAQATPMANVKAGDLVLNAAGQPLGWVIKKTPKQLKVLKPSGQESTLSPAKSNLMGQGQTIMVVNSMMGENLQANMPMLMAMSDDGDAMDKMIPLMLMSQQGQAEGAPAMNPMMLMMMANGDGSNDMMKMMAMQQMMGSGGGQAPAMDPMTMMMMLKK